MFGTEIQITTFILALIELVILPFQLISCASNPKDKSRQNFLYLTVFFLIYNVTSGLLPDDKYPLPNGVQVAIAWFFGGTMVIYFMYYIYSEFGVKPFTFYTVRKINIIFIIIFFGLFVIPFSLLGKYRVSVMIFMAVSLVMIGFFTYKTIKVLVGKFYEGDHEKYYRLRIYSAYFSVFMIFLTAITATIGDYQTLEHIIANSAYIIIGFAYIRQLTYRANVVYEAYINLSLDNFDQFQLHIKKHDSFGKYHLTTKEMEIATLILQNHKYKKIADMVYIAEKTVSKHASNIFKKTQVKNKEHFLKNFNNL